MNGNEYSVLVSKSSRFLRHHASPIQPAVPEDRIDEDTFGAWLMQFGQQLLVGFQRVAEAAPRARLLREEQLTIAGKQVDCYVIELPGAAPPNSTTTLWIDKGRYIVLQEDYLEGGQGRVTVHLLTKVARVNEPLPDGLFVFSPPAGAREVKTFEELRNGDKR